MRCECCHNTATSGGAGESFLEVVAPRQMLDGEAASWTLDPRAGLGEDSLCSRTACKLTQLPRTFPGLWLQMPCPVCAP